MLNKTLELQTSNIRNEQTKEANLEQLHYTVFLLIYLSLWLGFYGAMRWLAIPWPQEVSTMDFLLLSLATFRLTEIVTEEKVASSIRALFCERVTNRKPDGTEEEVEVPTGKGLRRVAGELLLCPWCAGVWIATFLIFFWILLPHIARAVMLAFGVAAAGVIFQILTKLMDRTRQAIPKDVDLS